MADLEDHNREIHRNLENWQRKPLLRKIYLNFHRQLARHLTTDVQGGIVELGSGVADITTVIPNCIRTDLCANPWIDQLENAYRLSFDDLSVSNLILFDVFHHLRYPGTALKEFRRVLVNGGRVILFEPCVSLLGRIVYGLMHQEPLACNQPIQWLAPADWEPADIDYYAAQGNASRIFLHQEQDVTSDGWHVIQVERFSALSYVASGGYSGPQLYPQVLYPAMQKLDRLLDHFPRLFSTRLLVTLEKRSNRSD